MGINNMMNKVKSMKNKMTPKSVIVHSTERLSHSFQRVIFTGADVAKLGSDCAGQYIKLMFNQQGGTEVNIATMTSRPVMRTYTIRDIDPQAQMLTVDFVLHNSDDGHQGVASQWAANAKPGDSIKFGGPGPIDPVSDNASYYLFVADMTSLPAATVNIERLPATAQGHAFIQVADPSDVQPINAPEGIELHWLVGGYEEPLLCDALRALPEIAPNTAIWCACEFNQMRGTRRHFSDQENFDRKLSYFSSYWKPGVAEDGHKALKREDAQQFAKS